MHFCYKWAAVACCFDCYARLCLILCSTVHSSAIYASTNILTLAELCNYNKVHFFICAFPPNDIHKRLVRPASVSVAILIYDAQQPRQHPENVQQQIRMINDFSLKIHKHKSYGLPTRQMWSEHFNSSIGKQCGSLQRHIYIYKHTYKWQLVSAAVAQPQLLRLLCASRVVTVTFCIVSSLTRWGCLLSF